MKEDQLKSSYTRQNRVKTIYNAITDTVNEASANPSSIKVIISV